MAQTMTLCGVCEEELRKSFFKLTPAAGEQRTAKKDACDYCGRKLRPEELRVFAVNGR